MQKIALKSRLSPNQQKIILLLATASLLLSGCSRGSDSPVSTSVDITVVDGYIKDANVTDANNVQAIEINGTIGLYRFSSAPTYPIKMVVGSAKLVDTNAIFDVNLTANSGTVLSPIATIIEDDITIQNNLLTTMNINTATLGRDYVDANDTDVAKLSQLCYAMLKDTNATTKFKARLTAGAENNITALIDKAITEDSNTSANKDGIRSFLTTLKTHSGSVKDFERDLNSTKSIIDSYVAIQWKGLPYGTITSSRTGKVWLDRNLGATQVCTVPYDTACYGDYYQWGRNTDGHENNTSDTNTTLATDINSSGSSFIRGSDWTASSIDDNGSLRSANWSKIDGTSVCPVGYRVPTAAELAAETTGNGVINSETAFSNFLKLPSAGYRHASSGSLNDQGSSGYIWSSSPQGSDSKYLSFNSSSVESSILFRGHGQSVRCLKDYPVM